MSVPSRVLFIVCVMWSSMAFGQLQFGVKAGVTSFDFNANSILVESSTVFENLVVSLQDAHYGFMGGAFAYWDLGLIVLNPEVSLSSIKVDYLLKDANNDIKDSIKSESYRHLNMPFLVGLDIGFLQIKGGPVGHYFLNSTSEMLELEEYEEKWKNFDWGFQAGIGIKVSSVILDVRYEKNNNNFASHFTFNGEPYSFDQKDTRYIATLGILF